ncbi:E3 ubiquitin-protein ligase RNF216-like [Adelges cooleyi]|uniref:E3 ubiquitin-protein ligase RNF216-like n=1 Tax=Adelges cooleyi TaxID=133065 RepID=UPI00217F22F5|nr:E3 ubiquitin-protein ligase RNF216-like [Adelges cooleyi]
MTTAKMEIESSDLIDVPDVPPVPDYKSLNSCINYPKFLDFGWEVLYKKYTYNFLRLLEDYPDICRIFLIIKLDLFQNNLNNVKAELNKFKLNQSDAATQLTKNLVGIIQDADPIFLDIVGEIYVFNHEHLYEYIEKITSKKKCYPKFKEHTDRVKNIKIIKSLTTDFKIEDFLRMCPNPVDYFESSTQNTELRRWYNESVTYLSTKFPYVALSKIRTLLYSFRNNLTSTYNALANDPKTNTLKRKRKPSSEVLHEVVDDIEYLKEVAYLEHKDEIINYIENQKTVYKLKVEEAKSVGQLCTCECCYNDELLVSEIRLCPSRHLFCLSCIKKGIEVAVGGNQLRLKCFANCDEEFNLVMLKDILDEKLYQRIVRLKQAQEIKEAEIEGLDTCAFCDYSVILSPSHKIVSCLNPECKKETCRECREESHFPYKCDQIEKSAEVKVRTMIENKMTEVLIRTCSFCNRKFVKEDGCNKMTCSCGKIMCYICRKPIPPTYEHFYHDKVQENKCPLYTDENIVHATAVEAAARLIINELKEKQPELLRHIDIDKILPVMKKTSSSKYISALNVNRLVATVIGQNEDDVKKLTDLRFREPPQKKARR